ncbi:MAG: electron transfer flavoprotein subunit alpha/FixB family protein [Anaerolineaceae bacterium]|nr:electron transfer flavoprotein subunit alpha/FixB family protein [Anaerolineaceae bacterium]
MATVRPKSARPTPPDETRVGEILEVTVPKECFAARMKFEQFLPDLTQDVPLEDADIVVSGGRGMKNKENFAIISRLAESLGGSVGVSRAAVDQGWQPYPRQVGLSGKTVAPELYIACGISGAVQHIVGMQTANTIIAINIDPNAQIFQIADFGIVGDLFIVLPHVIDLINEAKGRSAADV